MVKSIMSSVLGFWDSLVTSNRYVDAYQIREDRSSNKDLDLFGIKFPASPSPLYSREMSSGTKFGMHRFRKMADSPGSACNETMYSSSDKQTPIMKKREIDQSMDSMQLQDFDDTGNAPPPPIIYSWRRIDRWTETNYPELYDQLAYPATQADLDYLEQEINFELPLDLRESFFIHDGQESGGRPTGLIFGMTLLDIEDIIEEWNIWKRTAQRMNKSNYLPSSSSISTPISNSKFSNYSNPSQNKASMVQKSWPPGAILNAYAHEAWIPLAKDYEGNNIGVDLCPGPNGHWGQVILFGADQNEKYVVARSWAHFLADFVDDLES